MSTAGLVDVSA